MTNLHLPDQLARRLQQIAKQENRPVEDLLEDLLERYTTQFNAFTEMDGMFDDEVTDLSTSIRQTMSEFYQNKHDRLD